MEKGSYSKRKTRSLDTEETIHARQYLNGPQDTPHYLSIQENAS